VSDRPKLLWHSNAPHSPTGYGSQTALFTPHLAEHYELGISAFYGVEGNIVHFNDIPVYPGIGQTYGNECIAAHTDVHFANDRRGGLVVTLMDVWVLDPQIWSLFNVASWVPVDHEPCPPPVASFFQHSHAVPVAMSRFGQKQLEGAGLEPLYVPHAVDTSVYAPQDKAEAREKLNMPKDAFIVGMVAANKGNPSRKCFSEAFQAFKLFRDDHPEALLYLHCELSGRFDGVNLPELMDACGLAREAVLFADQYRVVHFPFSRKAMAQVYSSLDVLLNPSAGEGFGIPVLEANACGVPAIVSDFSAQPEVCGSGWKVSGRKWYTPLKAWQFTPDVEDIHDALRRCYARAEAQVAQDAEKGITHAAGYDINVVMAEHMLPALSECYERFDAQKPQELVAA
jgi:glycosyltransferase involved in cell wall biosynthesis